jgi:radical SAM superfamily enzyme YgiQ (UPF0313 family)
MSAARYENHDDVVSDAEVVHPWTELLHRARCFVTQHHRRWSRTISVDHGKIGMTQAGCAALVYGYESFSPQILKRLGKGASRETNLRSFFWTMESGIRPIPNQIIGFPSEDFDSLRADMHAWEELGIVVKPFFAMPYPGSMWYDIYKEKILAQYGGDLNRFLLELGDATKLTAVISENFHAVELYGLRELMINFDYDRIAEYESERLSRNPDRDAMKAADAREKTSRQVLAKLTVVG